MPILEICVYSLTLWFGLYLLARDFNKLGLRYAGLGLISYAVGLAFAVLLGDTEQALAWYYLPFMLPSVFWMGATLYLVPDVPPRNINVNLVWMMAVVVLLSFAVSLVSIEYGRWLLFLLPPLFLIGAILRVRQAFKSELPRRPLIVLFTATVFFGLAAGLLLLPANIFTQDWALLGISMDVILLGVSVAVLDAYDEGTNLLPDALRSLLAAFLAVTIFGGQVLAVMAITGDNQQALTFLLFALVTTLLVILAFADTLQSLLDSLAFSNTRVKGERDQLRAVSTAVARVDESHQFAEMADKEFARLTRRALSHYADLNKLAASPLIRLPQVTARLDEQEDNVIARANTLKSLLREGIEQLKPDEEADFAPTDEWRYYNVLYFPYIAGLKPYSRRFIAETLDETAEQALDWFRTYVPERTLYNWQKIAAELIARQLRASM